MLPADQVLPARYQFEDYLPKGTMRLSVVERVIVYVGVLLAPFSDLRLSDFFFSLSDFCFCLSFVFLLVRGRIERQPINQATQLWLLAFILLFAGLFIGSYSQSRSDRGVIVIGQYMFAYLVLLAVLVRKDPREAHRLAAIFVASIILVDIHGIYTFYFVGYVPTDIKGVVTGSRRLATVLGNPNLAASINALAMPALLYFWSSGRLKTYLALPLIAIFLVTVVLTSSNSGLLMMALCLAIFTVSILTARLVFRLVLGGAILIGILGAIGGADFLPATFQKRVLGAITSGDISEAGTFESRAELAKEAIEMISNEHIIFVGIGADQFRERSAQDAPVHVLYLLLWVEGGLPALIGWLMFSGVGVVMWLSVRKAGGPKYIQALLASTIAIFLAIALFNPHMYARYWTLPVFLCFGLTVSQLQRISPNRDMNA
jgi:O-antigen ligase